MSIRFESNAETLGASLRLAGGSFAPIIDKVLSAAASAAQTQIRANASGRPGPRVQTGNYRRSWTIHRGRDGTTRWYEVGTNSPQGWRLEMGFVGVDSLGRHYNQPPFPHVGPVADKLDSSIEADMGAALAKWVATFKAAA